MMRRSSKSLVLFSSPARNVFALGVVVSACWFLTNQYVDHPISVNVPPVSIGPKAVPVSVAKADTTKSTVPAEFSVVDKAAVEASENEKAVESLEPIDPNFAAIQQSLSLLDVGHQFLEKQDYYEVKFYRQERVKGELKKGETVRLKVRHHPFSVYMKWLSVDKGREVLYVADDNDGKLLFHYGGWRARLLPILRLDPHGTLAKSGSRHPITEAGLLELVKRLTKDRRKDIECGVRYECQVYDERIHDRDCYCFDLEYENALPDTPSETYRKSLAYFDKEFSIPIEIKNFTWLAADAEVDEMDDATRDELTLVEHYSYSDIEWNQGYSDEDFSSENSKYRFRR